jgi:RsiW-degrading membrane proteinase PrsW (M82 family)
VTLARLRTDPPADGEPRGWYPDPCDPAGRTERRWDGDAWTASTRAAAGEDRPTERWHRRPLAFLTHRWFHLLLAGVVCSTAAAVLYERAHGVPERLDEVVGYGVVAIAVLGGALAAAAFADHLSARLRLREVVGTRLIASVCAVSLPVVIGITLLERPFPDRLSDAVAGPIEELAKLAVPLALYALSPRFRPPRVGLSLVLASAASLGVYEVAEYAYEMPSDTPVAATLALRPLWDAPVHMVLTGIIGAVLWRTWRRHGGLALTPKAIGTVVGVMALHSFIDWSNDLRAGTATVSVLMLVPAYLWFKTAARQLVPPGAVASNPPWWRPWRLATADAEPQGSTRTSQPTDTRPGRRTAA